MNKEVKKVIDFVHKAIDCKSFVNVKSFFGSYEFDIYKDERNKIGIYTNDEFIYWDVTLDGVPVGRIYKKNLNLTDRDKLSLEALYLDALEYEESRVSDEIGNFFVGVKPITNIDCLDDYDEPTL